MVHLRILDLSKNNLYGTIPLCLNNVTAMVHDVFIPFANMHRFIHEHMYLDHALIKWQGCAHEFNTIMGLLTYIDLSNNNLTGNIPYELTGLHELIALNLSMNALHGKIPSKIGQMEKLEILDLSRNKFSGGIPLSMSHMAALNYLDVSCNNLSGRIPSGTQLQSFEPSRYSGNAGLCGNPLTKSRPHDKEVEVLPLVDQSKGGDEMNGTYDLCRWFYIGGATGFAIGFWKWIACGALLVSHWGRKAFFHFMDSLEDWVYVKVRVFIAKWQCIAHA
ncbi:putative transferase [Helianthus debilis subsp. tardiflorus]